MWAFSADTGYTVAVFASRRGWDFAPGLGSFDPHLPAIPVYSGPWGILGPTNLIDATPLRLQLPEELIHAHSYGNDRTTSLRGDGTVRRISWQATASPPGLPIASNL